MNLFVTRVHYPELMNCLLFYVINWFKKILNIYDFMNDNTAVLVFFFFNDLTQQTKIKQSTTRHLIFKIIILKR